jgi:phosphoglycerate dehydrogenase-like enzyme
MVKRYWWPGFLWVLFLPVLGETHDPSAAALIRQLDLDESASPASAHARWSTPKKIVVSLPGRLAALPEVESRFRDVAGNAELIFIRTGWGQPLDKSLVGDADAVIGFCHPDTLSRAKQLVWLHSFSVGVDRCLAVPDAVADRLLVTNNQRLSGPNIAEHVMAMMLSLGRGLPLAHDAQAREQWQRGIVDQAPIREFSGRTLLVAGLGGIGTEVARRAHGLGMRVLATRHSGRYGPDFVDYVGLSHELKKLAAEADVVVNALPLTDETIGLFDADFFEAVKQGAFFISVGRGRSTVTDDLVAALAAGRLGGAGLDVTDPEPLPSGHPLWGLDNVIITPHIAGYSPRHTERQVTVAVENLRRYVAGEPLLSPVDLKAGY